MPKRKAPAGCYWRGKILWGEVQIKGQRIRWSLGTDDPAIAKARRQAGKERSIADLHGDARRTFEEAFTAWDVQLTRSVGPKTAKRYLVSLKQLSRWLDGRSLPEIDGRLVAGIIRERQKAGVTNATIKRDLGALSSVMNFCVLQEWIEANPVLAKLDLVPFEGYEFLTTLPAFVGKPILFWHDKGEPYASFAPTFNKLMNRVEAWAKANGVEFRRFRDVFGIPDAGGSSGRQVRRGGTSVCRYHV